MDKEYYKEYYLKKGRENRNQTIIANILTCLADKLCR